MSSYSRQPPSSLYTKKPTDISQHPRDRGNFDSKYNPLSEYGSKLKNKIRRRKSQEIDKLPKDTHNESLNNDDILPDSFNKICKQVASMEREIIEPDLKQLDHDRDLREQQVKDRIEKAGEYQQEIQKTVDELQENIKLENQMIEEQASKKEFERSEQFRVKIEESIGEAQAILQNCSDKTNTQKKNIKEICNIINKLSSSSIKDCKILNIDQLIKELEEIIQNENCEPENINFCEDEVPGKLNNTSEFNGSKFLNYPNHNSRLEKPSSGESRDKNYVNSREKYNNKQYLSEYQYDSLPKKSNSNITENLKDETLIDANKIKEALTQAKEHNGSTLNVFKSLDTNIKNYLNSSEVYQAIQDLQSQKHFEDIKESEESKRIRSELQVLENINFDELKTKASECKSLKNQLIYLNNKYKTLDGTISRYKSYGYKATKINPVKRDLKVCDKEIEEHKTLYNHLISEIQGELISLLSIFETYYSKRSYPVRVINDITTNGKIDFHYFDRYMNGLKEEVISLKTTLESELRKEGPNSQNSNNLLEDSNYTDSLNTIISGFIDNYLKNRICSINYNLQCNLEQIEQEIIFPTGDKVKILNKNSFAKKNYSNEESKEFSEWTRLNPKYKDSDNAALLGQIGKNLSTSKDNSFYYNERLGKFKIECTRCSYPNWISKETIEKIKQKVLNDNQSLNMSQTTREKIIKALGVLSKKTSNNILENEVSLHNGEIEGKQKILNETIEYSQTLLKDLKKANTIDFNFNAKFEENLNDALRLIQQNKRALISPKNMEKQDSSKNTLDYIIRQFSNKKEYISDHSSFKNPPNCNKKLINEVSNLKGMVENFFNKVHKIEANSNIRPQGSSSVSMCSQPSKVNKAKRRQSNFRDRGEATTDNEYLQKKNIELEHNLEELKEKYSKLKAKKKEIKKKNIELENKNTELKNTNAQLEKQIEKDIEEYNELVKRYEKYRNRCRAYKSKEESKGTPKVPRKPRRNLSHPSKMKSRNKIDKSQSPNLQIPILPSMLGGYNLNFILTSKDVINQPSDSD
ncbi:unnamed protein product [Moneuplotes crassus]|uniref:Uncharacterized protein n=1 Tax=Euplotes crassus TaxID=5936 RepID=A0AAD1Y800_EUPCR|nr:unnamed protein product [Moneuplotes crassus]